VLSGFFAEQTVDTPTAVEPVVDTLVVQGAEQKKDVRGVHPKSNVTGEAVPPGVYRPTGPPPQDYPNPAHTPSSCAQHAVPDPGHRRMAVGNSSADGR
jgi:hypothetical protein